jgi:Asp-tRNA(Asn)/Glu-tRNA(Gln) amidotransferase A subunit family amidase
VALAGIPIVREDNVDTREMPTTVGSLAFEFDLTSTCCCDCSAMPSQR